MTLASTAALIASLELKDNFTKPLGNAERALGAFEKRSSTFSKIGGDVSRGLSTAIGNLERLAVAGVGAIGSQVKFGLDALEKLDLVTTQTNAVLKSTGSVAGETSQAIRDLANKYEDLNATIDDKVIQSGENLLLTFTNIRKDAFEPTLQAALDMNQAMGGGPDGLQGTIQKLGKALNDPVKGLQALGRVGVTFSADQQKQIKDLVAHNKLYDAQKVILDELTKRFGGSFKTAGTTAAATFAKLGDAAEDAQMALADAMLPALKDIASTLNSFLRDPATIAAIRSFGQSFGAGLQKVAAYLKTVDWKGIGDSLKTAAGFAKGVVDAFLKAPSWLQEAVVTGWGLNKLTGGAVTSIFGDLVKGIGGQFLTRGSSPLNPLFTKEVGIGGGLPAAAAGATEGAGALTLGAAVGAAAIGTSIAGAAFVALTALYDATATDAQKAALQPTVNADMAAKHNYGHLPPGMVGSGGVSPGTPSYAYNSPASDFDAKGNVLGTADFNAAVKQFAAALKTSATKVETAWDIHVGGLSGVSARSRAITGHDPTKEQAAAILQRDQVHHLAVIEKSNADNATKLARLQAFAADVKAHGDTKTAAKVDAAIKDMKAKIATAQQATTSAVSRGTTTLDQAIAAAQSSVTVNVNTSVSVKDVVTNVTKVLRYGNNSNPTPL